jgi:exodeoxyribonuclease VII large subunit
VNQPAPQSQPGGNVAEYTVSELSGAIKRALEEGFGYVRLRGEISGFRGAHASGHCYFALKDDKAKIEAVIWKMTYGRLKVKPEEGMEVIVQGRVTSYPGSSKYQIVIESLEPAGLGALMALLEERKRKFAAEGLFAEERKKARPFLPRLVGIVTSPTGAVIRDMLHGFTERFPTRVIVWPVRVQGETSAAEVAAAIHGFNALALAGPVARPDVLIVARGGGSLEDLWGFNEEIVVRAVAASRIPVISAVGHETDWTLIDLVADARAPTPTKAAEWAVPKFAELADGTDKCGTRLTTATRRVLQHSRAHLKAATRGLPRLEDLLAMPRQRFDACERRLGRALIANARIHHTRYARIAARLRPAPLLNRISVCGERAGVLQRRAAQALRNTLVARRRQLEGHGKLLDTLSYQSVLQRGFALVRDSEGRTVRAAASVHPGDRLDVELHDGRIEATAQSIRTASGTEQPPVPAAPQPGVRRPRGRSGGGQGSLF